MQADKSRGAQNQTHGTSDAECDGLLRFTHPSGSGVQLAAELARSPTGSGGRPTDAALFPPPVANNGDKVHDESAGESPMAYEAGSHSYLRLPRSRHRPVAINGGKSEKRT